MSTTPEEVKVETTPVETSSPGLPTSAKLAHFLATVVSAVIALAVSSVLADGNSVIQLKPVRELKVITNSSLKSLGLDHRLDELLGDTYGVGLHHDQSGHSWYEMSAGSTLKELVADLGTPAVIAAVPYVISTDDLKHPVPFLGCHQLKMAGICAMTFGFIAEIVAVLMVIFHALALADLIPRGPAKVLGGLIWLVLSAGFMIVVFLAVGVFTSTWTCDNTFIPSIVLAEHFDYNYGFYFAIVGMLSSLLIFNVTLAFTSTKYTAGAAGPGMKSLLLVVCGVTVGLVLAGVGSSVILGANGYLEEKPAPDASYNPCYKQKPKHAGPGDHYFNNVACMIDEVSAVLEQAGANVTRGYRGGMDAGNRVPITQHYTETDLCPVNVHWHLGAEHLSVGQFDDHGHGPHHYDPPPTPYAPAAPPLTLPGETPGQYVPGFVGGVIGRRQLAGSSVRQGFQCHHYDSSNPLFQGTYDWQHCTHMEIGQTYEIHWPHSAAGACGTEDQYQSPFYDGVFCRDGIISIAPLNTYEKIGVQGQVFTVVNSDDPQYYHDNLIAGALSGGDFWSDVAMYTGSTTGTSRDNNVCSRYTPITWQVDRKCHMISASSFDKLCQDMKAVKDDMSMDLHPHGAREVVSTHLVANNQQSRK